ncbi:lamin-like protein [Quillaja saponaria]|uniref:Lamin-like protein n=1 Tax=Quillaja saponaria TaxID=32244 RepID=A0AAD7LXI3_QUISA|nr:lamin-like protein [Quillaja saponaria]
MRIAAETGFIKNVTKGGRDVFQLMEAKPYYFICGYGRCFNGMKVAINVEEFRPTPAPAAHKSGSAFDFWYSGHTTFGAALNHGVYVPLQTVLATIMEDHKKNEFRH